MVLAMGPVPPLMTLSAVPSLAVLRAALVLEPTCQSCEESLETLVDLAGPWL